MSRSEVMSRVKHRDTGPELRVRRHLWASGLRFRLASKGLVGKPDLVFLGTRLAIFVHGCFWHQHPGCPNARMPKSRREFWQNKLLRNVERDAEVAAKLKVIGWGAMTIWECETRNVEKLSALTDAIKEWARRNH